VKLYRLMKFAADGKPLIGTRRNMLGVRPTDPTNRDPRRNPDVKAVNDADLVSPGEGLSTSTDRDALLRRVGKGEAVFEIDPDHLGADLNSRLDRADHWLIEPSWPMTLLVYQQVLAGTRDIWKRV
jgi:hypothetical protein